MKTIDINIKIRFCRLEELSEEDRQLVEMAVEATNNAYAKYSNFRVGAAVRLENGLLMKGANQENAAFPVTLCAERTAIFAAQANYPEQPITPCGSCRQVMLEIEDRYKRPLRILLYGQNGVYIVDTVKDLMPLSFVDASMKGK